MKKGRYDPSWTGEAEALSAQCGGLLWICPLDPEIERREMPANIRFVPVRL